MPSLKIVHVIHDMDVASGGPPVVAAKLASAQAALGHQVSIACCILPGQDEVQLRRDVQQLTESAPVSLLLLPETDGWRGFLAWGVAQSLQQGFDGTHVVHVHGVWNHVLVLAASIAKSMGVPYVVAPHGLLDPWAMSQRSWKKRIALRLGRRRMLEESAFLHVLNSEEGQLLKPLSLKRPYRIIPNGISVREFADLPSPGCFRSKVPSLGDAPYVLFLGRLHYKKGLDILASAFEKLSDRNSRVHMVVAGPDGGARTDFERRIQAANAGSRVHLVGILKGREKLAALIDAACFCLPSRQEGFSVAIFEALAAGIPAVISDACHFPEVASHGAGVVTSLDPSEIAAALSRVLEDQEGVRKMGAAGQHLVRTQYTWDQIAANMMKEYDCFILNRVTP